jgi:hypothetical protein
MRLVGALAVVAIAFGAALYLHRYRSNVHHFTAALCIDNANVVYPAKSRLVCEVADKATWYRAHQAIGINKPGWGDPAAAVIAIGGLSVAAAVLSFRHRRP